MNIPATFSVRSTLFIGNTPVVFSESTKLQLEDDYNIKPDTTAWESPSKSWSVQMTPDAHSDMLNLMYPNTIIEYWQMNHRGRVREYLTLWQYVYRYITRHYIH